MRRLSYYLNSKGLRSIVALGVFVFLFLFFVPTIYDATMFQCTPGCSGFGCPGCPTDPSGLKSVGYAIFHWGGFYPLGGSGYGFAGSFVVSNGSVLTVWGVLFFFTLPLVIVGVALLEPEIVRRFRAAAIGFVILALLDLALAANLFSMAYNGWGLVFDLLGAVLSLIGVGIISYLYVAGGFSRRV